MPTCGGLVLASYGNMSTGTRKGLPSCTALTQAALQHCFSAARVVHRLAVRLCCGSKRRTTCLPHPSWHGSRPAQRCPPTSAPLAAFPWPPQPKKNPDTGEPAVFGTREPAELFGPEGWCRAAQPAMPDPCPCIVDGYCGRFCDQPCEPVCPNQCSGGGLWFGALQDEG